MFIFQRHFLKAWSKAHQINRRMHPWLEQTVDQALATERIKFSDDFLWDMMRNGTLGGSHWSSLEPTKWHVKGAKKGTHKDWKRLMFYGLYWFTKNSLAKFKWRKTEKWHNPSNAVKVMYSVIVSENGGSVLQHPFIRQLRDFNEINSSSKNFKKSESQWI